MDSGDTSRKRPELFWMPSSIKINLTGRRHRGKWKTKGILSADTYSAILLFDLPVLHYEL